MRPIRLLILLLAITVTLILALVRPLQGRATRTAKRHRAHPARLVAKLEPRRQRRLMVHRPEDAARVFGNRVVAYARHFLGTPYRWGGTSPRTGFDCSGLVRFVYGHFGIVLPHSSWADLAHGRRIARRSLRPGDLVFFYGAGHVGIYTGRGRFIDAPHTGMHVKISTMHEYGGYYAARRIRHGG